ncbi:cell envelope biogenesis protein OmpA [Geojedonia litorea]|uniref:Cell envelope biogenesis protein OmpA n=1 Tax=Geojedonia litorea TaxID=1268269 RepID=A0ABV9N6V9_9FLAO
MSRIKVKYLCIVLALSFSLWAFGQRETNKWKAQIALGVNSPSQSGFVEDFQGKSLNFPTVNMGVQHMFGPQIGAKLDFGYNRISSDDTSPEFKLNYSRINPQLVFDPTQGLYFLPERMGLVLHAGPGLSFVKPLGNYIDNNLSFFNVMGGLELHLGIAERASVYIDTSYIMGFGKDFDPVTEGYGSFNGNLLTITFGITFSLSGCQYCDNE